MNTLGELFEKEMSKIILEKFIQEIKDYADGRKKDISRGAETVGLAALMVEKYGYGMMKATGILGIHDADLLTKVVDQLVAEIDPDFKKHRQSRWQSFPAGISISDQDGSNRMMI